MVEKSCSEDKETVSGLYISERKMNSSQVCFIQHSKRAKENSERPFSHLVSRIQSWRYKTLAVMKHHKTTYQVNLYLFTSADRTA